MRFAQVERGLQFEMLEMLEKLKLRSQVCTIFPPVFKLRVKLSCSIVRSILENRNFEQLSFRERFLNFLQFEYHKLQQKLSFRKCCLFENWKKNWKNFATKWRETGARPLDHTNLVLPSRWKVLHQMRHAGCEPAAHRLVVAEKYPVNVCSEYYPPNVSTQSIHRKYAHQK